MKSPTSTASALVPNPRQLHQPGKILCKIGCVPHPPIQDIGIAVEHFLLLVTDAEQATRALRIYMNVAAVEKTLPSVAGQKPQMLLIAADLPTPLVPRSPKHSSSPASNEASATISMRSPLQPVLLTRVDNPQWNRLGMAASGFRHTNLSRVARLP